MTDKQPRGPVFNRQRAAELVRVKGLSYARLADLTQASPRSVRRWMAGSCAPAPYSLTKLAQALGVGSDELLTPGADGRDLRYLRTAAGFSLALLATQTGLAAPHIHRLEAGKVKLTPAAAQLIAEALQVDTEAVITASAGHTDTAKNARPAVAHAGRQRSASPPPPPPAVAHEHCQRAV